MHLQAMQRPAPWARCSSAETARRPRTSKPPLELVVSGRQIPLGAAWRNKAQALAAIALSVLILIAALVPFLLYLH